eukprot:TRINITY_DN1846_c2_g1_i2.p1 TRINITY_DN1846_c2_g1~~TRINITY_DN1846_c2_g1_i2.p1  ORF type:complete len:107 (+),score=30.10 TRINITY_DN1846_c2_g1_i2:198-518(+)
MVQELSAIFPSLLTPLLHERDLYMTYQLRSIQAKKIVGVVGLGHVKGIQNNWFQNIDREALMRITANPQNQQQNIINLIKLLLLKYIVILFSILILMIVIIIYYFY